MPKAMVPRNFVKRGRVFDRNIFDGMCYRFLIFDLDLGFYTAGHRNYLKTV